MGEGGAGVTEAELREAVGWIVDRSPAWDERNMRAVQRFNRAIEELVRLRAEREDLISHDDAFVLYGLNPRYSE